MLPSFLLEMKTHKNNLISFPSIDESCKFQKKKTLIKFKRSIDPMKPKITSSFANKKIRKE